MAEEDSEPVFVSTADTVAYLCDRLDAILGKIQRREPLSDDDGLQIVHWNGIALGAATARRYEPVSACRHEPEGERCLVAHFKVVEGQPVLLPACEKCRHCRQWYRQQEGSSMQCLSHRGYPVASRRQQSREDGS